MQIEASLGNKHNRNDFLDKQIYSFHKHIHKVVFCLPLFRLLTWTESCFVYFVYGNSIGPASHPAANKPVPEYEYGAHIFSLGHFPFLKYINFNQSLLNFSTSSQLFTRFFLCGCPLFRLEVHSFHSPVCYNPATKPESKSDPSSRHSFFG